MNTKLQEKDLRVISEQTLAHYQSRAHAFWEGTKDHDVTQNYQAFLEALPQRKGLSILDLGCGPGRDLKYFKNLGHHAIGLDGCPDFCQMARSYSSCEVWQQDFLKLDLPRQFFDGIFANASLFHVPSQELTRVLRELHQSLKENGILFSSNPRGDFEGWNGQRYGTYLELVEYQNFLKRSGFSLVHNYYRPQGKPCHEQPWLAVVAKKCSGPKPL